MFYDLHMHSCLSPCADNDMTPNNICNMALLKELDIIAVSDHNSTKQLNAIDKVCKELPLKLLYGCELQTSEEVHCLAIFNTLEKANKFQIWLDEKMPKIQNDINYFGNQLIMNEKDEVIKEEENLLLVSLNASIEESIDAIHEYGGKAILAHVLDRQNSITTQLGFIPKGLPYDGIEVKSNEQKLKVLKMHKWIKEEDTIWFIDSDAHYLTDISEKENFLQDSIFERLWGV